MEKEGEKEKKKKEESSDSENESDDEPKKKDKKKKKKEASSESEEDSDNDKKKKKDKKKEASSSDSEDDKKKKKDKKKKEASSDSEDEKKKGSDSDSDGGKAKAKKKNKGGEAMMEWDDEEVPETVKAFANFIERKGGKPSVEEFFDELRMQQLAKGYDHKVRLFLVLQALGTVDAKVASTWKKHLSFFISQAHMKTDDILWAFDAYLHVKDEAKKGFAMTLKFAFDEDWITDSETLEYYNDDKGEGEPGFEKAQKSLKQFLEWLEKEDSSDDDDEDSD